MDGIRFAPPKAAAMMEALRGLGYSTAAALADVIDNSISAGATDVHLHFDWNEGKSWVSILDNGKGMSDPELEAAMTLGSRNPLDVRDPADLGRFGLGLKTASFSQCRKLTVASKQKGGATCCLRWDLDVIERDPAGAWTMLEGSEPGSEGFLDALTPMSSGTLVLWQEMDRVVTPGMTFEHFADLVFGVESRLAMTFHRLLEEGWVRLFVNGRALKPWDPFMMGHPAKPWQSPVQSLKSGGALLEAQCHVLPHKDMLSREALEAAAGPDGWVSQQGFYVYRNRRLLVAGGWLGLGRGREWHREEAHRLARIRLDMPNSVDAEWRIDVRKSRAQPPLLVRPWLAQLAEDTRERARKVFAYRGVPIKAVERGQVLPAWRTEQLRGGMRYRVDTSHPAVAAVLETSGGNKGLVKAMLRVIEETVPVQRIWLDTAENRDTPKTGFSGEPEAAPEGVLPILITIYKDMITRIGMAPESAVASLLSREPFNR